MRRLMRVRFRFAAAISLAMLCLVPWTSHAADGDFDERGWYGGLGASFGVPLGGSLDGITGVTGGFSLTGGYRIFEQVALEGEFEWLADFTDSSGFGVNDPILMTANVKAFAFSGRVQPWVLFGLGTMTLFDNTTPTEVLRLGFVLRFGAGFDYHINSKWSLTTGAAFVAPSGAIHNYSFITFKYGATYRF